MAVRKGNDALLAQLNQVIKTKQPDIRQLLEAEGIPLLDAETVATATH
jgi:mxaJ protein